MCLEIGFFLEVFGFYFIRDIVKKNVFVGSIEFMSRGKWSIYVYIILK